MNTLQPCGATSIMAEYTEPKGDTIHTAARENFQKVLETIDDPTNERRQFVYQREPRRKSSTFDDYPMIYIENVSVTTENKTLDGVTNEVVATGEAVVEVEDRGVKQKRYFDEISDDIYFKFEQDKVAELADVEVTEPTIVEDQRFTGLSVADEPVLRREVTVEFGFHVDMSEVST